MNITPEQIAKLIFHVSNLRWLEREHVADPIKDPEVEKSIVLLKMEIDKELCEIGLDEYFDLNILTEIIKIYTESNKLKQAS